LFYFLISDAGKETLGGGEKKLDDLFHCKEGDEATYFISEGLRDQEIDVGPSVGLPLLLKRERLPPREMKLKMWRF